MNYPMFNFGKLAKIRLYGEKARLKYPEGLGNIEHGPLKIKISTRKVPTRVDN